MKINNRKITHFSTDEYAEMLYEETIQEAVESYVDEAPEAALEDELVEVFCFAPSVIPDTEAERQASSLLDDLLERLDEDYNNCEAADPTTPTPKMLTIMEQAVKDILKRYHVGNLECLGKITVVISKALNGDYDDNDHIGNATDMVPAQTICESFHEPGCQCQGIPVEAPDVLNHVVTP